MAQQVKRVEDFEEKIQSKETVEDIGVIPGLLLIIMFVDACLPAGYVKSKIV